MSSGFLRSNHFHPGKYQTDVMVARLIERLSLIFYLSQANLTSFCKQAWNFFILYHFCRVPMSASVEIDLILIFIE